MVDRGTVIKLSIVGIAVVAISVGAGFGFYTNPTITWIALAALTGAIALATGIYAVTKLPSAVNSGSSIGVLSFAAKTGESITSLFVRFLPISLVWLGILLSVLTTNFNFIIPSMFSIITIGFIAALQMFFP